MDTGRHDHLPTWIQDDFKDASNNINQLQDKIFNLKIALNGLEEHKRNNTAPRSLEIKISVMVNQRHQDDMDKIVHEATKSFQATILEGLITARKKELDDYKANLNRIKDGFLTKMETRLNTLVVNDIINENDIDVSGIKNMIHNSFESSLSQDRQEIGTKIYLNYLKKCRLQEKRRAEAEERNIERTLEDSTTAELKLRIAKIEKQLNPKQKKSSKKTNNPRTKENNSGMRNKTRAPGKQTFRKETPPIPNRHTGHPKLNYNRSRQENQMAPPKGSGRVGGQGKRKPRQNSTHLTHQSVSKRKSFHKMRN